MAFGVMFHHFYDQTHPKGQGAISADDLERLIAKIGRDAILPAQDWAARARANMLEPSDICLTFDDALLCQYDVARPVLEAYDLTAFWFVYSSVFEGNQEPLELYRYFRTTRYETVDAFYGDFFKRTVAEASEAFAEAAASFDADTYLAEFAFYTRDDRFFRYLRDDVLGPDRYHAIMQGLMKDTGFDLAEAAQALWMTDAHLSQLHGDGHVIGLHSYSHPTRLAELSKDDQSQEYRRNFEHLAQILGEAPKTMSHPCNSYNSDTLDLLRDMDVTLGFRSNMAECANRSPLEFPRQDHANLIAKSTEPAA